MCIYICIICICICAICICGICMLESSGGALRTPPRFSRTMMHHDPNMHNYTFIVLFTKQVQNRDLITKSIQD